MAKKKTSSSRSESGDKSRVELRFDADLHEQVKGLCDSAGISVNQLMQGLARWAVKSLREGEPVRDEYGCVTERKQPGCLWAGRTFEYEQVTPEEYERDTGEYCDDPRFLRRKVTTGHGRGEVYCFLDFTERRVVREDT